MSTMSPSIPSSPGCSKPCSTASTNQGAVHRALKLEYLTVGWNLVEGIIAVAAGLIAGSVAILGFGIDSFVECASAAVMIWRLRAERASSRTPERLEELEHRARRLVAASLIVLAVYVTVDAVHTLWSADRPSFSAVGLVLIIVSIGVMLWLARAKRRVARELGSRAMEADAFQTTACWWLSLAALVGIALNGAFGWWWADPVAGFAIAALVAKEAREAWKGEHCC